MYERNVHMTTKYKTITSSTLRDNLSDSLDYIEQDKGQVLLIQRHGDTDAALINIDLLEVVLDSVDKKLLAKLKASRQKADDGQFVSFAEAFGKL